VCGGELLTLHCEHCVPQGLRPLVEVGQGWLQGSSTPPWAHPGAMTPSSFLPAKFNFLAALF
jgi:hypothetical protein